jgi:hypothetical protein
MFPWLHFFRVTAPLLKMLCRPNCCRGGGARRSLSALNGFIDTVKRTKIKNPKHD